MVTAPDGHVRLKNVAYKKFLIRDPNWIVLDDYDKATINNPNALFWPIKLDNDMVALHSKANNFFCKRLTLDGKDNCLNSTKDYITDEAKLKIVEVVLSRSIYNVKFHLGDARIYNEQPIVLACSVFENNNSEVQKFTLKLNYEDTTTTTWNANINTTIGLKITIESGIPKVVNGELVISAEMTEDYSWGETQQLKYISEVVHEVFVPPNTKIRGSIMATRASCDIPFSYTQCDDHFNGKYATQRYHDGVYKVINSYNFNFLTEEV